MSNFPAATMIKTNGVELEVFEAGPTDGKPIVLAHGFPELAFSWRHQINVLAEAGYHVIAPNQRGYGKSSRPSEVEAYDIVNLTGDLCGLLDHFQHDNALFIGHDWGAAVVWDQARLHSDRVCGVINLSVDFRENSPIDPIDALEAMLGPNFYMVHFNRHPGVADKVCADNTRQFLSNVFHTDIWKDSGNDTPVPDFENSMVMIEIAQAEKMPGKLMMSNEDLEVFIRAFESTGFTGGINWYRNISRNWELTKSNPRTVSQPALMIYGDYDSVAKSENLEERVPNVEIHNLDCGHWIQQERPSETNRIILDWLGRHYPA